MLIWIGCGIALAIVGLVLAIAVLTRGTDEIH
jgi:hypothetical protein